MIADLEINEDGNPIRSVSTSNGQGGLERVTHLRAEIRPEHVTRRRTSFPSSMTPRFSQIRAPGDERGHLVASQFSGPPEWYNLSPQSRRVNRNFQNRWIIDDWFNAEHRVRDFLDLGGDRQVNWTVDMNYIDDSNRPHEYRLDVEYLENGERSRDHNFPSLYAVIPNPLNQRSLTVPRG